MPETTTTTTLKRYSIRRYYTYVDAYEVEAETLQEADRKVDEALNTQGHLIDGNGILQVAENEYVDYDCTYGNEINATGDYVSDPEEL